ncbi:MAG: hypothetical protein R3D88_03915 [Alphaproteobacteria bacterium]|nr:hypothetical protein [Alphaproteobacteria bacterium]
MNDGLKKNNLASLKEKLFGTQGLITGSVIFGLLFIIVIIFQSCAPRKGTILYGLCSAFLEQQIPFPETIKHTSVEQYPKAVRIYFTYIDGFGQYQFEMTECSFKNDAQNNILLDRVFFNYIKDITEKERVAGKGRLYEVKKDSIDLFNRSQSPAVIISQDPDLSLPSRGQIRF